MEPLSSHAFVVTLALVGGVILIAALLSGLIERSRMPQVAVFLGLGAALGAAGLGLLEVRLDSPILRVVATISLVLVLFTDALNIDLADARRHAGLAAIVLGPGTLLSAAIVTAGGRFLLDLPWAAAAILGASLASTDPVLLRGVATHPALPGDVRQALRLESGMNDAVLLPIVVIASGFLLPHAGGEGADWAGVAVRTLLLGPGAGIAVGLAAVSALDLVRRRIGIRRDYESLYSLGVAFLAFALAEAFHGSGFLAAFAAGMTILALDVELCDCFLEYGETTAEMLLLFTFVLLGSSLIWSGFGVIDASSLLFVLVVFAARPASFLPALAFTKVPRRSRMLIAWMGPRGLSSLLLVLLAVFAGVPGSERLFSICCLVVLFSVAIHGGSITMLLRRLERAAPDAAREPPAAEAPGESLRVTVADLARLEAGGERVVLLDVRTRRGRESSGVDLEGTLRLEPDDVQRGLEKLALPREARLVAFCA